MSYSEKFKQAVAAVMLSEGGYVNDALDAGGETKYGISKRAHPNVDIKSLTPETASDIYYADYWRKEYDQMPIAIACKVFDMAVNMGHKAAHKCLQRALRACDVAVNDDGIIGPQTMMALGSVMPQRLLPALRSEHAAYYRVLVAIKPGQQKFIAGWLKRAYK